MFTSLITYLSIAQPPVGQAYAVGGCHPTLFGLKAWYYYLTVDAKCNLVGFNFLPSNGKSDLLLIGLAIVDDLLTLAGLAAVGFVIYGGILFITSQGSPEQTAKARNTIQNALIGLVISILSVAMVSYFGSRIG